MIQILELDKHAAAAMRYVLGEDIFKYEEEDDEDTVTVTLNNNAVIKFYGFDSSVCIDLGGKMFLLENESYWRLNLG